jgi:hypothetical protein
MTAAPRPPAGVAADPHHRLQPHRGEIASWRHTDTRPALGLRFYDGDPPVVEVTVWPGTYATSDPSDLRQMAWMLLAAAAWQERALGRPPAEPDPQLTIYDHLEAAGR